MQATISVSTTGGDAISEHYHIPRRFWIDGQEVLEENLLPETGAVILLAEPGAGKTQVLESMARRFGAVCSRATSFLLEEQTDTFIIDAFDEVAQDRNARYWEILRDLRKSRPQRLLLSSRSSEWESAQTEELRGQLGLGKDQVKIANLIDLNTAEQHQLYDHLISDSSFGDFHSDLVRFDLHRLLVNPQFLTLFATAYREERAKLTTRESWFEQAMLNLAREMSPSRPQGNLPTKETRLAWANQVFSTLLLSGADGICVSDLEASDLYPQLETLGLDQPNQRTVLETRLFRPGATANKHEPFHRTVAEYGGAKYLIERLNASDSPFSMQRLFALLAPAGVVRDDLRGLLGWLAALGDERLQMRAIEVDAYAVLANGDPARLTKASKARLLDALERLNEADPYFRRSDVWRTFSVAGFFTPDMAEAVRTLLAQSIEGHLRSLVLELLVGSPLVSQLHGELEGLVLDKKADYDVRFHAASCLVEDHTYTRIDEVLALLANRATSHDLNLLCGLVRDRADATPHSTLLGLFRGVAALKSTGQGRRRKARRDQDIDSYTLLRSTKALSLDQCIALLDELTRDLNCTCGEEVHSCHCLHGISKVIGLILDQYFKLKPSPHSANQIWSWVKGLRFESSIIASGSEAVSSLQSNHALRRALQARAIEGLNDRTAISNAWWNFNRHDGLALQDGDHLYHLNIAFDTSNAPAWSVLMRGHSYNEKPEERGRKPFRQYCRAQANKNPSLMREWAATNRARREFWRDDRLRGGRWRSRVARREREKTRKERQSILTCLNAFQRGERFNFSFNLARFYLYWPSEIPKVTHALINPEKALTGALTAFEADCPSPRELHKFGNLTQVFVAGALVVFRAEGSLSHVSRNVLMAAYSNLHLAKTFEEGEYEAFVGEIEHQLAFTADEAETFVRDFVEPQLEAGWHNPELNILERHPALHPVRANLPLNWLRRFPALEAYPTDILFNMASGHGDRRELEQVIAERCAALAPDDPTRGYWFIRQLFFCPTLTDEVKVYLRSDPEALLAIANIDDHPGSRHEKWPALSPEKIEFIQTTFRPHWPPVDLPRSFGTESPKAETAYRYLSERIWRFRSCDPALALPAIERLLENPDLAPSYANLRSIKAELLRTQAAPTVLPRPVAIRHALSQGTPATVEDMRAIILELLDEMQQEILAGSHLLRDQFYEKGQRLGEVRAMARVSNWLDPRVKPLQIHLVPEHQLNEHDRCDISATVAINGGYRTLVIEGKGQWHKEVLTAAKTQLSDRYSNHPDAEQQGIYLVIWYGAKESVAGHKDHAFTSAMDLKENLEQSLSEDLRSKIDVYVLNVSQPT